MELWYSRYSSVVNALLLMGSYIIFVYAIFLLCCSLIDSFDSFITYFRCVIFQHFSYTWNVEDSVVRLFVRNGLNMT